MGVLIRVWAEFENAITWLKVYASSGEFRTATVKIAR
jgi:hypothetical protein